jgi:hypothetical protein
VLFCALRRIQKLKVQQLQNPKDQKEPGSLYSPQSRGGLLEGLSPMSLSLEAGRKKRPSNPPSPRAAALSAHPNWVMSLPEWCFLNGFSPRTGRRIVARGEGPKITQLSRQKVGVTAKDNAAWQASRARKRG